MRSRFRCLLPVARAAPAVLAAALGLVAFAFATPAQAAIAGPPEPPRDGTPPAAEQPGAGEPGAADATAVPDAAARLAQLVDDFFEELLALRPLLATRIGDSRYDDRLEDSATAAYAEQLRALDRRYLDLARRIDPARLDAGSRLTWDVFVREREVALEGARFPDWLMPVDQLGGVPTTLAVYGSGAGPQPFRTAGDYDAFLARAGRFPAWVDQAIAGMRQGLRAGVTLPRVAAAKIVPQLRALAADEPEGSIFWQAVRAMPAGIEPAERERIAAAYRAALADDVLPAYRRLADFLEREYVPQARTTIAWSALPDGEAWYRYAVRTSTTTDLSPDEIHRIGLAEVARIRADMVAVKQEVGFDGDLPAFFRFVATDTRFFFGSGADLLRAYRQLKASIDAALPRLFARFPHADYVVREVEPFRAASSPGAFYQAPSADGSRPGVFYVNTHDLRAQPRYGMTTLALHEAAPGHHFQVSIAQELSGLPRFRRFGEGYVAYDEGWALYAESLGRELGLFEDPWQWYGRLSDEMLRAMRLVVDTGLHARGWTREQAIAYMRENSSLADGDIEAEVDRYIVWPAQALGYKVGELRIHAMRARAEQALGERFDVRAFHAALLEDGALPLDVLDAKIDRWIEARLQLKP